MLLGKQQNWWVIAGSSSSFKYWPELDMAIFFRYENQFSWNGYRIKSIASLFVIIDDTSFFSMALFLICNIFSTFGPLIANTGWIINVRNHCWQYYVAIISVNLFYFVAGLGSVSTNYMLLSSTHPWTTKKGTINFAVTVIFCKVCFYEVI